MSTSRIFATSVALFSLAWLVYPSAAPVPEPEPIVTQTNNPRQWLDAVQTRLQREQADVHLVDAGLAMRHDAFDLSLTLDVSGTAALQRGDDAPITLRTARLQQGGATVDLADAAPSPGDCRKGARPGCMRRAEVDAGAVTTWWEHHPDGLEQGWQVVAPLGTGPLRLVIETSARVQVDDGALHVGEPGAGLEGSALVAWDATGRPLGVTATATDDGFALQVDDDGAAWPITIDPVWTPWGWTKLGPADSGFGAAVALGGDVNEDGYEDALVGAPAYDIPGGLTDVGRVYLYLGSAAGLATTASQTWTGTTRDEKLGSAVAFLGDTNGDGHDDAAFGAEGFDGTLTDQGAVSILHGTGAALSNTAALRLRGGANGRRFGGALAPAGDVNNDGFSDLLVGVARDVDGYGVARLYLGQAGRMASSPARTWGGANVGLKAFGTSVTGLGDVNGDGFDDVAVGAPQGWQTNPNGGVFVYGGRAQGPAQAPTWSKRDSHIGVGVGAGDVNGDGSPDLLAGDDRGAVSVFYGGGMLAATADAGVALGTFDSYDLRSVTAGDMDADGIDDILVSEAARRPREGALDGSVTLFRGSPTGPLPDPVAVWRGDGARFTFGDALATGDIDQDLDDDLLMGAPGQVYSGDTSSIEVSYERGNAFVIEGEPGGPASLHPTVRYGWEAEAATGVRSGDVDGDGAVDLLILLPATNSLSWYRADGTAGAGSVLRFTPSGTPLYDLCDVNGDGADDVLVAGWAGIPRAGTVDVLYGSATGPLAPVQVRAAGNVSSNRVFCAGDINNDGYDDAVLQITSTSPLELWLGSAAGLVPTAATAQTDPAGTTRYPLVVAGDVNGDGFGDLTVADRGAQNGMIGVWFGGPAGITGPNPDVAWTGTGAVAPQLGERAASGGDVNGDGRDDLLVTSDRGAYLLLGSVQGYGPAIAATWTARSTDAAVGDVAGVGDVNGDGLDDVAVSDAWDLHADRPYSSLLSVYLGGAVAPGAVPWWSAPFGVQPGKVFPAGDLDGDGRADMYVADDVTPFLQHGVGVYAWFGGAGGMTGPLY